MAQTAEKLIQPIVSENDELQALVDEFGTLHQELALKMDHYEHLKKKLSGLANENKQRSGISLEGETWAVDYSSPTTTSKCVVGPQEFVMKTGAWDALTISTTAAKKALSKETFSRIFEESSGSRRFKRVRLAGL